MKRKTYIIFTLSYATLIFILSSIPQPPSYIEEPGFDKIKHVIEYSILGFFTLGCFTDRNRVKIIILVIIVCSLYGILDEIHQHFVPGRYSSSLDMVANSVGSILGVMTLRYHKKFRRVFENLRTQNLSKFLT